MPRLTLGQRLQDNATRYADVPAYVVGDHVLTHGALLERATRLASAMARLGVRRQDRVALLGRNSAEFAEVLAAGQLSGQVIATVNYRLAAPEVGALLADIDPAVVVADAEFLPMLRSLPDPPRAVVGIGADYEEVLDSGGSQLPYQSDPEDIACLIYTSGTTGRPKGAILGQWEMRALARQMSDEMRIGPGQRTLLVMPLFHIGAMAIGLGAHVRGGSVVLHQQFEPAAVLAAVANEGIDCIHLAPALLQQVLDVDDGTALKRLRTCIYAAAPMTTATLRQAMAAMPDAGFLNLYGQTEVIGSGLARELHATDDSERTRRRLASVGHPFPETEIRIVGDDGEACASGDPGEIFVRTDAMFRGYWNDGPATADTIRDGWCRTGDVGYLDEEGLLHLVDRVKDVVNTGGEKVYSREVEEAVASHPSVRQCAVIGVPDRRWGESVCAVVVAADGAAPDLKTLQEHVRLSLAGFKVPRSLVVRDALPVLVTGKIDKKLLRSEMVEAADG